jgi:hypothetical protein
MKKNPKFVQRLLSLGLALTLVIAPGVSGFTAKGAESVPCTHVHSEDCYAAHEHSEGLGCVPVYAEAHEHDDSCYEQTLVSSGHEHDENCEPDCTIEETEDVYESALVCELDESTGEIIDWECDYSYEEDGELICEHADCTADECLVAQTVFDDETEIIDQVTPEPETEGEEGTMGIQSLDGLTAVNFDVDGVGTLITVTDGKLASPMEDPESPDGESVFLGWFADKAFTQEVDINKLADLTGLTLDAGVLTLYAQFGAKNTEDGIVVNFWLSESDKTNGNEPYASVTVDEGNVIGALTKGDPTGSAAFLGWYNLADLTNDEALPVDINNYVPTESMDLYAKFTDLYSIIRFRNTNGDIVFEQKVKNVSEIDTETAEANLNLQGGQTLSHWYIEGGDESEDWIAKNSENGAFGLITLVPKVAGTFTVQFDSNGGTTAVLL